MVTLPVAAGSAAGSIVVPVTVIKADRIKWRQRLVELIAAIYAQKKTATREPPFSVFNKMNLQLVQWHIGTRYTTYRKG